MNKEHIFPATEFDGKANLAKIQSFLSLIEPEKKSKANSTIKEETIFQSLVPELNGIEIPLEKKFTKEVKVIDPNELERDLVLKYRDLGFCTISFAKRNNPVNKDDLISNFPHIGKDEKSKKELIDLFNKEGFLNCYLYDDNLSEEENYLSYKKGSLDFKTINVSELRNVFTRLFLKKITKKTSDSNEVIEDILSSLLTLEQLYMGRDLDTKNIEKIMNKFKRNFLSKNKIDKFSYLKNFFLGIDINNSCISQ